MNTTEPAPVQLPPIPHELSWHIAPPGFGVADGRFEARAAGGTDLFNDPFGRTSSDNAAMLLFEAPEVVRLSARVAVGFRGTFDAGVLCVWQHATSWAKLCF